MIDPVTTFWLRVERADEHLARLDTEVNGFLHDDRRELVGHFEAQSSEYVFRVTGDAPDPAWGLIVGDVAHNLRSALDNLVCALVELRGGDCTIETQFVIADRQEDWDRATTWDPRRGRGDKLRGLLAEDRAVIQRTQPYWGEQFAYQYRIHPLHRLRVLSNTGKHHALLASYARPFVPASDPVGTRYFVSANDTTGPIGDIRVSPLYDPSDRTEIARVRLLAPGANPEVRMEGNITLDIAFCSEFYVCSRDQLRSTRNEVALLVRLFEEEF